MLSKIRLINFSNFWNPDEQNEENEEEFERFSGRDGILFLVDARIIANDEEQFRDVLGLIETTSMNRIIQSEKDLVWLCHSTYCRRSANFNLFCSDWCCVLQYEEQSTAKRTN